MRRLLTLFGVTLATATAVLWWVHGGDADALRDTLSGATAQAVGTPVPDAP